MTAPREQLANLLKDARIAAGYLTQAKYAQERHVSRPLISRAESATQPIPSAEVIAGYVACGADQTEITRLIEGMSSGTPEWFMPYKIAEAEADTLRYWQPIVVPGILQTRDYMRALFEDEGYLPGRIDELTVARIERQAAIGRAHITAIIHQHVLQWLIGSPTVMAEQVAHLSLLAERRDIALHVIPEGTDMGLWGGFDLAARGSLTTVCLSAIEDISSTAGELISKAALAFEQLLGAALPRGASLALTRTAEETWKQQI